MKNVLVPTETHEVMRSVLQTARLVQERFGSYLEGFALRPAVPDYVPIDMVSGLAWHVDEDVDRDTRHDAHLLFQEFMDENNLPERDAAGHLRHGWHAGAPAGDLFLAAHTRIFDLVILGRPLSGKAQPAMASVEAVLFETGRPLLIAPPEPPRTLGDTVVIAWNGSTETARTVALGMPFLRSAKRVVVLTVEGGDMHGPDGEALALALARHGIPVETATASNPKRDFGQAFLREAQALGGDLLLKGAFTQSRLRQLIFGGATLHILQTAEIPVLMAN